MSIITIASFNIGSLYTNIHHNLSYLKSLIEEHSIDVLCMQEFPDDRQLLNNVVQWGIFQDYFYKTTSLSHVCHEHDMGIVVFSKKQILSLESLKLDVPKCQVKYNGVVEEWHDKYFLCSTIAFNPQPIMIITGHGFPFHRYGLENAENKDIIEPSFKKLDIWIEEQRKKADNVFIAADFNLRNPLDYMPYSNRFFSDVFDNIPTRPSGRKTDGIWRPKGMTVMQSENITIRDCDGTALFDHNFILASF